MLAGQVKITLDSSQTGEIARKIPQPSIAFSAD
jgi:hypothetical protein